MTHDCEQSEGQTYSYSGLAHNCGDFGTAFAQSRSVYDIEWVISEYSFNLLNEIG